MKLNTSIRLESGVYVATVEVEETTPLENERLRNFGQPTVSLGGSFTGVVGDDQISFTLPHRNRLFPSDTPYTAAFALADFSDAGQRAQIWRQSMEQRLAVARTELMAKDPAFVGEASYTLDISGQFGSPLKQSGTLDLIDGEAVQTVVFASAFPAEPNSFTLTVTNVQDEEPLALSYQITGITTSSMEITFTPAPNSSNYKLSWSAALL